MNQQQALQSSVMSKTTITITTTTTMRANTNNNCQSRRRLLSSSSSSLLSKFQNLNFKFCTLLLLFSCWCCCLLDTFSSTFHSKEGFSSRRCIYCCDAFSTTSSSVSSSSRFIGNRKKSLEKTTTTITTSKSNFFANQRQTNFPSTTKSTTTSLAASVSNPEVTKVINGDSTSLSSSSTTNTTITTKTTTTTTTSTNAILDIPTKKTLQTMAILNDDDDNNGRPIFDILAARAAICLFESELRRDAKGEHTKLVSSSATNWINDATAFALQKTFDRIKLKLPEERTGLNRDEASAWIRWMKSSPTPLLIDFSNNVRNIANKTITNEQFEWGDITREEFLARLGCRLWLFPSGASLSKPLMEPPASIIYGKLLYGGITRYRQLVSSNSQMKKPRKTGERTEMKTFVTDNVPVWMQYGGTERMYEAVDMGPAAVLEIMLLPRGQTLERSTSSGFSGSGGNGNNDNDNTVSSSGSGVGGSFGNEMFVHGDMIVQNFMWKPQDIFDFYKDPSKSDSDGGKGTDNIDYVTGYTPISQSGLNRNKAFESDFKSSVGGLQPQIDAIVRRVLDGRVIRPAQEDDNTVGKDETMTALATAAMEAEELAVLGLTPVRGLLLYGPPGTGKTLLARQIARALRARAPKIVSAPELLDRWVGGSEKLVRGLFAEAEAELAACGGDATKSALHVVVIDEIDAVFRKRSSAEDSGEATRASVVNQILAKLDGVDTINNILLIGMTNRRELLDSALLRPGRLEVQIEVPLPDKEGRREILQIHFDALRRKGRLSKPLCCAIDGVPHIASSRRSEQQQNVQLEKNEAIDDNDNDKNTNNNNYAGDDDGLARTRKRKRDSFKRAIQDVWSQASSPFSVLRPCYDLAADSVTGGFSGADIAGLVRCAGSLALSRSRKDGNGVDGLLITLEDVKQALVEVSPK